MNPLELTKSESDLSKNHISNVSNNMVNVNENRVSALSISYIEYFYHVFPLHLNSFNRLFSDVISPKLSILISSVNQFICLTSDIDSFIPTLKDVSKYLSNSNPAQSLLKSIDSFNAQTYVNGVKNHINEMIEDLDKKIDYEQIISDIYTLVRPYNENLKTKYEDFKTKIGKHKSSLEGKIQEYIKNIKDELDKYCTCVKDLSSKISDDIAKMKSNHGKLSDFAYTSKEQLMIRSGRGSQNGSQTLLTQDDLNKLGTIFNTHKEYKKCLESSCPDIKDKLTELNQNLEKIKDCSTDLASKLKDLSSDIPSTTNIDEVLRSLNEFKTKLEYNNYKGSLEKLEQIGKHITTMKTELEGVGDKVDEKASKYITGLQEITITKDRVETDLKKIKETNDSIINQLKIAKSAIEFHKSLKDELEKLNLNVTFRKFDIDEFEKNSKDIKGKLTTFEKEINSKLDNANQAIERCKQKIEELKKSCQKIKEQASGKEDESILCKLKEIQNYYTQEIPKITKFIEEGSEDIEWIQVVLTILGNNKDQALTYINTIKCKIFKICELSDATTKLPEIKEVLNKFVELQENTKSFIDIFKVHSYLSSLSKYSDPVGKIITDSKKLSGKVNYYIGYLNIIQYIHFIVTWIKSCYQFKIQRIKQIFINFKDYVNVITCKLENIKADLCLLKSTISACFSPYNSGSVTKYDMGKLKDYISTLKFYLRKIKTHFTTIKTLFDKIDQESSYIDDFMPYLNYFISYIESYTNENNNKQGPEKFLIEYLKSIKIEMTIIPKHKYLIINGFFENKIKNIESRVNKVEQSINELECAIEGLARNMIRCSLKSLSNHLNNYDNNHLLINYSMIGLVQYSVVVNKLFESSIKIHKIFDVTFSSYDCLCISKFEKKNNMDTNNSELEIRNYTFRAESSDEIYKMITVSKIRKLIEFGTDGNHICLCMVIKFVMYPQILSLVSVISFELDALSFISRKFEKYGFYPCLNSDYIKVFIIIINLLHELSKFIELNYKEYFIVSRFPVYLKCFCSYYQDPNYHLILSLMLFLSSLIENIWTMDIHSITVSIGCLSSLLSGFGIISSDKNKTNDGIWVDLCKYLFCPLKFCRLSSKLQVVLDFVSISLYDPNLSSAIKSYIYNLSLANLDSFKNYIQSLANSSKNDNFKSYINWFLNKYESIDGSTNICSQFKNQCCLLASNVLLYIGVFISCKIKAKLYPDKCQQLKDRLCGFLKCICDCKNNECCIKEILGSNELCNGQVSNCENLLEKCIKQCCENNCCSGGCPCKQLKDSCDKLKELCCNSSTNGLCKILQEMSNCLCGQKPCSQCNCSCCKIVIESILIIQEMFKLNVSNISKNIIVKCKYFLETMIRIKIDKDVDLIINTIENNFRYNKRSLKITKNNYSTHFNTYTDHKNIANRFPSLTMVYASEDVY